MFSLSNSSSFQCLLILLRSNLRSLLAFTKSIKSQIEERSDSSNNAASITIAFRLPCFQFPVILILSAPMTMGIRRCYIGRLNMSCPETQFPQVLSGQFCRADILNSISNTFPQSYFPKFMHQKQSMAHLIGVDMANNSDPREASMRPMRPLTARYAACYPNDLGGTVHSVSIRVFPGLYVYLYWDVQGDSMTHFLLYHETC